VRQRLLSLDIKWQAVIFGLFFTTLIFGIYAIIHRIFHGIDSPILLSPGLLLPGFAVIIHSARQKQPEPVRERIPLLIKLNAAGYIIGIIGACLMATIAGFTVSCFGATLSFYGFLQLGEGYLAAKSE